MCVGVADDDGVARGGAGEDPARKLRTERRAKRTGEEEGKVGEGMHTGSVAKRVKW